MGDGSQNCRTVSEIFLHVFNFIVLAFGIVILSIAAFLLANLEEDFNEVGLNNPIIASLVFGCFFVVFAIIGIIGTCTDNSCLLLIYILGVLCLSLGVIASGIFLLTYTDKFENVQDGVPQDNAEERILDFELAMFQECCASQPGVIGIASCDGLPNAQLVCFSDQERFDSFRALFDAETCDLLSEIEFDGKPLVGTITDSEGACGNGIAFVFVNNINQYVEDNLTKLGAANIVAGVVILLLLIAACVVLWTKEEEKKKQQLKKNNSVGCF